MCLSFTGCKGKTHKPINEESNLTGKISDNVEFRVHDDNSKIWLDNSHIEKISVETAVYNDVFGNTEIIGIPDHSCIVANIEVLKGD